MMDKDFHRTLVTIIDIVPFEDKTKNLFVCYVHTWSNKRTLEYPVSILPQIIKDYLYENWGTPIRCFAEATIDAETREEFEIRNWETKFYVESLCYSREQVQNYSNEQLIDRILRLDRLATPGPWRSEDDLVDLNLSHAVTTESKKETLCTVWGNRSYEDAELIIAYRELAVEAARRLEFNRKY